MTLEQWIIHFLLMHKHNGSPSPDEMRLYPKAFSEVLHDHNDLHVHFYTGHEHTALGTILYKQRTS